MIESIHNCMFPLQIDLSRLKIKLVGLSTLDDYQMEAADVNFDGKVSLTDLSNLKMYLVGLLF